jgi:hypothetical protein
VTLGRWGTTFPLLNSDFKPRRLSLDTKIGLGVLFVILALGGFKLDTVLVIGGIALAIWAYAWLWRHAPITAAFIGVVVTAATFGRNKQIFGLGSHGPSRQSRLNGQHGSAAHTTRHRIVSQRHRLYGSL